MNELKMQIKELLIEELHLEDLVPAAIENHAPLFGDGLGLDSLDALQLAVAVEERFRVRVPEDNIGERAVNSIDDLAGYIARRSLPTNLLH